MIKDRNIFIEGIQGMGKSTLLQAIARKAPELQVCREGEYSPVELKVRNRIVWRMVFRVLLVSVTAFWNRLPEISSILW